MSRPGTKRWFLDLSRREFLIQQCQAASLAFLPSGLGFAPFSPILSRQSISSPGEFHVHPRYREPRALDAMLAKLPAGSD
ncbi:MAG: hypothetical protein WBF56_02725, partial [Candidatus Acidiferrales bacterium]